MTVQVKQSRQQCRQQSSDKKAGGYLGPDTPQCRAFIQLAVGSSTTISETLMLSRLVHYIPAIRPPIPWLPSSLGISRPPVVLRMYSWSSQSQPANWSHLNDIYGKAVDVNPKAPSMTPEERWYMLSRSRTAISTLPKGPYAGKIIL